MLPMGNCQVLPPHCQLQAEMAVLGSQQGFRCGFIGTVTTGQEPVLGGMPANPYSVQISHPCRQGPSTYEAILSDHPQQSTVSMRCGLPKSGLGFAWHQNSSGSMPPEVAVGGSMSQTYATNNSTLPHVLMSKCQHFMLNTYRGWTGH